MGGGGGGQGDPDWSPGQSPRTGSGMPNAPEHLPPAREGPTQVGGGGAETCMISLRKKNTKKYKIKYKSEYLFRMRKVIAITKKFLKWSNIINITKSGK